MGKNRKLKWDKVVKGRKITTTYGENYTAGDDTKGLFQQADDNSWTPISVEQARDIYVPNVTDPVSNSYTQLGPMPTLTVTSPDWETIPYNVEDNRFGSRTPITTINVRKNKNTGEILPEDYRQALAIKDWYAKYHPKSDPSENFINDLVFTAATLGTNKNVETVSKGISSLVSNVDPVVKSAVKNYIAKPLIAGSIWDNAQQLVFGQSGTEYFTNYLVNKDWNPTIASIVGASTNPVYLINFGSGLVSSKLSNSAKTLLGIESKNELGNHLWSPTYEPSPLQVANLSKGFNEEGSKKLYGFINPQQTPIRKPLSFAERMGIPKGDRGNLSVDQKQALEDLEQYMTSGQYRQALRVDPKTGEFGYNFPESYPLAYDYAQEHLIRGSKYHIVTKSSDGNGEILITKEDPYSAAYNATNFPKLENGIMPGQALYTTDRPGIRNIVLTSPYVDMNGSNSTLSKIIDKSIIRSFWQNINKLMQPGSYTSGDIYTYPLGNKLIQAFKNRKLYNTSIFTDKTYQINMGLSPDSYSSIIRQAQRPGNRLRWGVRGFNKWTNSSVTNKRIQDAADDLRRGLITPEEYETIFNTWVGPIGGRPLQWMIKGNKKIPVHPHPFIYKEKNGGKLISRKYYK